MATVKALLFDMGGVVLSVDFEKEGPKELGIQTVLVTDSTSVVTKFAGPNGFFTLFSRLYRHH